MQTHTPFAPHRQQQHGIGLLEALVALLVLSLGMLAIVRVQSHLRLGSEIARQRTEAVRLAQETLETQRAYAAIAASGSARSWAGITTATTIVDAASGYASNTRYTVSRQIANAASLAAKHASVTVAWTDRTGEPQRIELNTVIAAHDPVYGGALAVAPGTTTARGAFARSSLVPLLAKDLGNGTSALKPTSAGTVALVFDNASGRVSARCSGIGAATATRDLILDNLTGCVSINGLLLSGNMRFSQASPPDAARGNDAPPAFSVVLGLTGGTYATASECSSEAVQTAAGDRYVAYHCLVVPRADGRWSGRSTLVPSGWTIGGGANDRRVCRYTADLDSNGSVDGNEEHPAEYLNVDRPLANQNFLVVKGSEACPAAATAQHQP